MRKIVLLLILLLSSLIMFACGEKETININKTNIVFYARHFEDWSDEFTKSAVNRFNELEDNDVYVTLKIYDSDTYTTSLVTVRENGNCPDLYMNSYSSIPHETYQENIVELNQFYDSNVWNDLKDNVLEFVTFNDKIYGMPWFSEPSSILFYRKDILQKYGFNEAPKTFDELYNICSKIQPTLRIGQYSIGLPISQSDLAWATWGMQYNLTNGLAVSDDWLESRINHDGYKELTKFFYTCVKNNYCNTSNISSNGYTDINEALYSGNIMMSIAGSWQIALLYTLAKQDDNLEFIDKIGIAPIPTLDGNYNTTTATNGGWCYSISSQSNKTKQEAAAKFIKWLFFDNPEILSEYFIASYMSRIPASKKVSTLLDTKELNVSKEWIDIVNSVSILSKSEALYSWDISYEVSNLIISTFQSSSSSFESAYQNSIKKVNNNISMIMSRESYTKNPWYKESE